MEKIDRLGWAAGLVFVSYGLRIGIRGKNAEAIEQVGGCLPPAWRPSTATVVDRLYSLIGGGASARANVRLYHLLYAGAARLARTLDRADLQAALESDLQLYVAEMARRRVFVHAGVVGWCGRAVIIPAHTFKGKSTLVAALVRAGATYYSDEYAVLDARGRVHPYARPLSVRGPDGSRGQKVPVEVLGGRAGVKPLPVGLVLLTEYRAGARWRPRAVSSGRTVLDLLAHTVSARRQPAVALEWLQQAVAGASVWKGVRGEADEMVAAVLRGSGN